MRTTDFPAGASSCSSHEGADVYRKTPLVSVDEERYNFTLESLASSLPHRRFHAVGAFPMANIWRNLHMQYGTVCTVTKALPSDLPIYRVRSDVDVLKGVEEVSACPSGTRLTPCADLWYYPGPLPILDLDDPGYYTWGSLAEWRLREHPELLFSGEKKEYHHVPTLSWGGLYPVKEKIRKAASHPPGNT